MAIKKETYKDQFTTVPRTLEESLSVASKFSTQTMIASYIGSLIQQDNLFAALTLTCFLEDQKLRCDFLVRITGTTEYPNNEKMNAIRKNIRTGKVKLTNILEF